MNFLKAEIERKKRQLQEKQVVGPGKKYFKRSELMEKEREEYLKRHQPKAEEVEKLKELKEVKDKCKEKRKLQFPMNIFHLTNFNFSVVGKKSEDKKDELDSIPSLPRVEVIRRLRERFEPITLFGETESDSCQRLRSIEVNEPDHIEGIKNDFKEAMDKVEKVLDARSAQGSSKSEQNVHEMDLYETEITYEELREMLPKVDQGDMEIDCNLVAEFIKFMMTKWSKELEKRDEDDKRSVMGKRETGIHAQTR